MASKKLLIMVAIAAIFLPAMAMATDFIVGDDSGWTFNFDYQAWAKDKVFRVGDKLVFQYPQGYHNVFKVNGTGFKNCDIPPTNEALASGNDTIVLKTPGRKWYICGVSNHCADYGQKLKITVQYSYGWAPTAAPAPAPISEPWTPPSMPPTRTEPSAAAPAPIPEPWAPASTPIPDPWSPTPAPAPESWTPTTPSVPATPATPSVPATPTAPSVPKTPATHWEPAPAPTPGPWAPEPVPTPEPLAPTTPSVPATPTEPWAPTPSSPSTPAPTARSSPPAPSPYPWV